MIKKLRWEIYWKLKSHYCDARDGYRHNWLVKYMSPLTLLALFHILMLPFITDYEYGNGIMDETVLEQHIRYAIRDAKDPGVVTEDKEGAPF